MLAPLLRNIKVSQIYGPWISPELCAIGGQTMKIISRISTLMYDLILITNFSKLFVFVNLKTESKRK